MKVFKLFLYLLAISYRNTVLCRVYKHDIHSQMERKHRTWRGKSSNTGENYGGWLVYIKNNNDASIVCCGAYYAPLLVLTSANCMYPFRYDRNMCVESTVDEEQASFALIVTTYFPEGFTYMNQYKDIALVRLAKPIKGKLAEFIGLCNRPVPDYEALMTIGWGFDSLDVQPMSLKPTHSTVIKRNHAECVALDTRKITYATVFCAEHPRDRLKCRYDGGCPIVWHTELCGIVSFGPLCRDPTESAIYTNISMMRNWVEDIESQVKAETVVNGTKTI